MVSGRPSVKTSRNRSEETAQGSGRRGWTCPSTTGRSDRSRGPRPANTAASVLVVHRRHRKSNTLRPLRLHGEAKRSTGRHPAATSETAGTGRRAGPPWRLSSALLDPLATLATDADLTFLVVDVDANIVRGSCRVG